MPPDIAPSFKEPGDVFRRTRRRGTATSTFLAALEWSWCFPRCVLTCFGFFATFGAVFFAAATPTFFGSQCFRSAWVFVDLAAPASSIGFPSNFLSLSLAAPSRWSGTVGGSSVRSRLVAAEAAAPSKVCPAIESGVYFPDKSTSLEMQTVIAKAKLTLKNLSWCKQDTTAPHLQ